MTLLLLACANCTAHGLSSEKEAALPAPSHQIAVLLLLPLLLLLLLLLLLHRMQIVRLKGSAATEKEAALLALASRSFSNGRTIVFCKCVSCPLSAKTCFAPAHCCWRCWCRCCCGVQACVMRCTSLSMHAVIVL
jgi:hypothetical protein